MKIAIIISKYYEDIGRALLNGACTALSENGLTKAQWEIFETPGSFEIPYLAKRCAGIKKYDGIIALGCVIKGETKHFKAVCEGVTYGIQKVSIEESIPIGFGVLMCLNIKQAKSRCKSDSTNKGYESALALLQIIHLKKYD